jgi:hypothetical protein
MIEFLLSCCIKNCEHDAKEKSNNEKDSCSINLVNGCCVKNLMQT